MIELYILTDSHNGYTLSRTVGTWLHGCVGTLRSPVALFSAPEALDIIFTTPVSLRHEKLK